MHYSEEIKLFMAFSVIQLSSDNKLPQLIKYLHAHIPRKSPELTAYLASFVVNDYIYCNKHLN